MDSSSPQPDISPKSEQGHKPRLTVEQKKKNHVTSENKRRGTIREQYTQLCKVLPGLDESDARSEGYVLTTATNYIISLIEQCQELVKRCDASDIPVPEEWRAYALIDTSTVNHKYADSFKGKRRNNSHPNDS